MRYTCPVCGYSRLPDPPTNYEICPSCGTEFGYDDFTLSHVALRSRWLEKGAKWHSKRVSPPANWNPYRQLFHAGLGYEQSANDETSVGFIDLGEAQAQVGEGVTVRTRLLAIGHPAYELLERVQFGSA